MGNLCAFKLFGLPHIVYLLMSIAIAVIMIIVCRKLDGRLRKIVGISLLSVTGLFAILEFVGRLIAKAEVFENLPLFIWDVFLGICIFVEFTDRESWVKFAYFIIVPISAIGLFVVPNFYTTLGNASLSIISYFLINILICYYYFLKLIIFKIPY